ncbi:Rpn family recombination-promoting nuclease/putative transposase [Alicyclobacillus fodiniaquatilis]|uniref:Rpn family recombination-promoting nuclease/putative transposase n=2 Tax=Alicyclobacillus fodiniaquatilis TaxID=1661150 RepID=A0ABW4JI00_9BACL
MDLLKPSLDFVFKRIFGVEENRDILIDFLNAIFESANEPGVTEIEILNPFLDKTAVYDKQSVLDIKARTADHTIINIEIQLRDQKDMEKRTLYYWSKLYGSQLVQGEIYRSLCRTVTINILGFNYIDNERYHNTFHLREDNTGLILTDDIEIHMIELEKLRDIAEGQQRKLVRWMLFLLGPAKEKMEEIAMKEPAIQKALTTLEFLSQDKEIRELYEARQKALHDWNSSIHGAREDGIEEGKAIGKQEGKIEVAMHMLSKGMSRQDVATFTGLSVTEIEQLQRRQTQ